VKPGNPPPLAVVVDSHGKKTTDIGEERKDEYVTRREKRNLILQFVPVNQSSF
jgi:hypothetical protein